VTALCGVQNGEAVDDDAALLRRLRDGDAAVFDELLAERLRSFLDVAEGLRPVAFNRLARRRAAADRWGTATANFVRDLRADAVQLARVALRSAGADGGGPRGRSRAPSTASSRPGAGESVSGSAAGSIGASSTATSGAGSQRTDRSGRRPRRPLVAPSTLASIPDLDLRDVDSTVSSPLYTVGSDLSFVTNSRGL